MTNETQNAIDERLLAGEAMPQTQEGEQKSEDEPRSLRQRIQSARQAMDLKQKAKDKKDKKDKLKKPLTKKKK